MSELKLMAIEARLGRDWRSDVERVLSSAGYSTEVRRSGVFAWNEVVKSRAGVMYSDAFQVARVWLGERSSALGVLPHRVYLAAEKGPIDRRPENEVVESRPQSPTHTETIRVARQVLGHLESASPFAGAGPVRLSGLDVDVAEARSIEIHGRAYAAGRLNETYRAHGFEHVPADAVVSVCPLEGVSAAAAADFASRLRTCAVARGAELRVQAVAERAVYERLRSLRRGQEPPASGRCILFLLPSRTAPASQPTLALLDHLEAAGVPFRRAYANDPVQFSIPNQLPSVLMAVGGTPHLAPTETAERGIWTIGVDLSHPRDGDASTLALTLVDSGGMLVHGWTMEQPRDETARTATLRRLLAECASVLRALDPEPQVMVLRDGRMLERENISLYSMHLGRRCTVIECRKRGNPPVLTLQGESVRIPTIAEVPSTNTVFVIPSPPRDDRSHAPVLKVSWHPGSNGLDLSAGEIARLVLRLCVAPGLGVNERHLPAPVYWADGIACATGQDLRFRGLRHSRMM